MGICGEERNKKTIKIKEKHDSFDEGKINVINPEKNGVFSVKIVNKVMKSICKITIKTERGNNFGTGFFLNYSDELKLLLTNYHVINPNLENANIEIEIHNKKIILLELKNRFCKYIEEPKDIAIIEIKESDEIYKDIEFLDYDLTYTKNGYSIYKNGDIFSVEHPFGNDASCSSGTIINILLLQKFLKKS